MTEDLRRLEPSEVEAALAELAGWEFRDAMVRRRFVFADFVEAVGFIVRAAIIAEALNHHPDWSNLYDTVDVALETHDVGGISRLDIELARKMNELAGSVVDRD